MVIAVPSNEKEAKAIIEADKFIQNYQTHMGKAQWHAQKALCILTTAGIDPQTALQIVYGKCRVVAPNEIGRRDHEESSGMKLPLMIVNPVNPDDYDEDAE